MFMFSKKCVNSSNLGNGDICIIRHTVMGHENNKSWCKVNTNVYFKILSKNVYFTQALCLSVTKPFTNPFQFLFNKISVNYPDISS